MSRIISFDVDLSDDPEDLMTMEFKLVKSKEDIPDGFRFASFAEFFAFNWDFSDQLPPSVCIIDIHPYMQDELDSNPFAGWNVDKWFLVVRKWLRQ